METGETKKSHMEKQGDKNQESHTVVAKTRNSNQQNILYSLTCLRVSGYFMCVGYV